MSALYNTQILGHVRVCHRTQSNDNNKMISTRLFQHVNSQLGKQLNEMEDVLSAHL